MPKIERNDDRAASSHGPERTSWLQKARCRSGAGASSVARGAARLLDGGGARSLDGAGAAAAGRSWVSVASSSRVRAACAAPTRSENSSSVRRPSTTAWLSAWVLCSRSSSPARIAGFRVGSSTDENRIARVAVDVGGAARLAVLEVLQVRLVLLVLSVAGYPGRSGRVRARRAIPCHGSP